MTSYISSSTELSSEVASALFTGLFDMLTAILPFAIGILVFWMGYRWARRALGGG